MYKTIVVGMIDASIFVGQPVTAALAMLLTADRIDSLGDIVTILVGSSILILLIL